MLLKGILGVCIVICTITDILKREVDIRILVVFSTFLVLCGCIEKSIIFEDLIAGICIGGLFAAVSLLSDGAIGMGDAWIYALIVCFMGFPKGFFVIFLSIVIAFFSALYLVIFKKKKKKYEMPLVPFMFAAYLGCLLL